MELKQQETELTFPMFVEFAAAEMIVQPVDRQM